MRLALISDIHGNNVALEAVLAAISTRAIAQVICLGDVASTGPE
jgi:predicted phosphodiesterase